MSDFGITSRPSSPLPLFDQELYRRQEARPSLREQREADDVRARFERFHADNPEVYDMLVRLARHARRRRPGRRIGIRMLWERMRWQFNIETDRPSGDYKLNDHYTSRYARLMMQREHDLADAFELRELRSGEGDR